MYRFNHTIAAAVALVASALLAYWMVPRTLMAETGTKIDYATIIPTEFAGWKLDPATRLVLPVEPDSLANKIYSQMIGRGYFDGKGNHVMLLIAYGPRQNDQLQLHRPEICYLAEGFRVISSSPETLQLSSVTAPVQIRRMVAQREGRTERISYWMRIGDDIVSGLLGRQAIKFRYGLRGIIPDGALIRVSTINVDEANAKELHDRFLKDLIGALPDESVKTLVGANAVRSKQAAAIAR